jgi:hypothetical protein
MYMHNLYPSMAYRLGSLDAIQPTVGKQPNNSMPGPHIPRVLGGPHPRKRLRVSRVIKSLQGNRQIQGILSHLAERLMGPPRSVRSGKLHEGPCFSMDARPNLGKRRARQTHTNSNEASGNTLNVRKLNLRLGVLNENTFYR